MGNPTLSDVARAAGVSYATADRVIYRRGNVAEKSIRKVQKAMRDLGYVRDIAAANLSRGRVYRLAFLIPKGRNAFFQRMRLALDHLSGHLHAERVRIEVIDVDAFSADGLAKSLNSLSASEVDGLGIVGVNSADLHPPLQRLRDDGVAIVGLVSDLPSEQREAYIGIENTAAGRTAARLIGLAHGRAPGRILPLAGALSSEDHSQRLGGFRTVIADDFPNLKVLDPILTKDDPTRVQAELDRILSKSDEVTAIYNAGAGNSGLVTALQHCARLDAPICVVHELVAHTRGALVDGLIHFVIDQRPDVEAQRAVTLLRALIDRRELPPMPPLVPTVYVRDNVPPDPQPLTE